MNYSIKILLLLVLYSLKIPAQQISGTRQIALANSDLYSTDTFSLFNNPARLHDIKFSQAGLYYSPAPFEIKELSFFSAVYCQPTPIGAFSIGSAIFGFELYKETEIDIGYSHLINNFIDLGISLKYKNISIKNYGSTGIFLLNLGTTLELSNKLGIAFYFENLTHATLNNESNQLPISMSIGLTSSYIQSFSLSASVRKEIGFNPSIMFGIEHKLVDNFFLRFGASNQPDLYCFGIAISYNIFEFGYAVTSHPDLGLTHQFDLIYKSP